MLFFIVLFLALLLLTWQVVTSYVKATFPLEGVRPVAGAVPTRAGQNPMDWPWPIGEEVNDEVYVVRLIEVDEFLTDDQDDTPGWDGYDAYHCEWNDPWYDVWMDLEAARPPVGYDDDDDSDDSDPPFRRGAGRSWSGKYGGNPVAKFGKGRGKGDWRVHPRHVRQFRGVVGCDIWEDASACS